MLKRTPLKRAKSSLKRSPMKKGAPLKKVAKSEQRLAEDKLKKGKRTQFYEECKVKVGFRSAVSNKVLVGDRINYHHVKPKSKYPEVEFCFEVILPVTMDEHSTLESNPEAYVANLERIQFVEDNWEGCVQLSKEWELNYENKK
jgi:hypothetical protein